MTVTEPPRDPQYGLMRIPVGPAGRRARRPDPPGGGWLAFAGVLILLGAAADVVVGVMALSEDDSFDPDDLVVVNLTALGIFYLVVAALKALVAVLIFARNPLGAILGIVMAMASGFFALLSILSNPGWSLLVMAVDLLIIFGLWAYGLRRR